MKSKKKVLHVIASLENGGAERQLVELLKSNRNHGVILLLDAGVYKQTLDTLGIKYWELRVRKKILAFTKINLIIKIIKNFNPDIIQSWMYNSSMLLVILKILSLYKKPLLWCIRCSNMLARHYSISLKLNILICKYFSSKVDKIIYNSLSGMIHHTSTGFNKKKNVVILNGVDSKRFKYVKQLRNSLRKEFHFKSTDIVIICVARVDPMKNHDVLLKAFCNGHREKLQGLKLVLIGKGTEQLKVPKDCLALGMKLDIEKYYNMADVIILPSAFGEGFSNVLVEGMLTGLLPIATNVGDSKKIIGDTGYILEKTDVSSFKDIFIKLSKINKSTLANKRHKAKLRAAKLFSLKTMLEKYQETYKKVLG